MTQILDVHQTTIEEAQRCYDVPVQVVETEITPQLAFADDLRGAETEPLPHEELLHMRR